MLHTRSDPNLDLVTLAPGFDLLRGRAHEFAGPARRTLALIAGARLTGPVLWLRPSWGAGQLMGDGIKAFLAPGRLVLGAARTAPELLWAAEEALRTGLVPLVVVELSAPPDMTPVRRLHLAAEAGAAHGAAPLALLLTPGEGGAAGIETRWRAAPAPGWARGCGPRWRIVRSRARMAPAAAWEMRIENGAPVLARERTQQAMADPGVAQTGRAQPAASLSANFSKRLT